MQRHSRTGVPVVGYLLALSELQLADEAWMEALQADPRARRVVNARYLRAGHGQPGTPLRAAYERYEARRLNWYAAAGW